METGWLIELADEENEGCTTGRCLGIVDAGDKIKGLVFGWDWTTPDMGLRFAREQDARAMWDLIRESESPAVCFVEHQWG